MKVLTYIMIALNSLYEGDCMEIMPQIDDKSIDLLVLDPPYNIGKAKWDKIKDYIEWCGKWMGECQRVLKDNGSLYLFHNNIEQIVDLMLMIRNNTNFIFKQFIVWNKRFESSKLKGYMDGYVCVDNLRNYKQMAEYILFYTFQDETGSNQAAQNAFRGYLRDELKKFGIANDINKLFWGNGWANSGSNVASHFFGENNQNCLPTPENYRRLQSTGYFQREYEDLRSEYEDLRYTFNNQKTHHSVWNYEIAERCDHITPKPVSLIENIIRHSSNQWGLVLDPFAGSGATGVACKNLNRNFILIEKDAKYCDVIRKRLDDCDRKGRLPKQIEMIP